MAPKTRIKNIIKVLLAQWHIKHIVFVRPLKISYIRKTQVLRYLEIRYCIDRKDLR